MSTTITIANNLDFCDKNGLAVQEEYDCCVDFIDNPCGLCDPKTGMGKITNYPFEMNITCSNFSTLWSALGLDVEYDGEIYPQRIEKIISRLDSALIVRGDNHSKNFYSYGITQEQAERYIENLSEIVKEAIRREEKIVWY